MLSIVGLLISVIALGVSGFVARAQYLDRQRAQADLIAGWCVIDDDERGFHSVLSNASSQPIYDVVFRLHTVDELDYELPQMLEVVPPGNRTVCTHRFEQGEEVELPNPRPYITFRDGRGRAWSRDTHGRLDAARRPIDDAPLPSFTGRIERD